MKKNKKVTLLELVATKIVYAVLIAVYYWMWARRDWHDYYETIQYVVGVFTFVFLLSQASRIRKFNKEIVDEYPKWWIDYERSLIMNLLSELISNIIQANSIYVSTEQEYHNRRTYWNNAIGNCNTLLNEFEYIRHVLPIDAEKYMSYVDMINNEIALIKGVRKSDNKVLKKLTNTKE